METPPILLILEILNYFGELMVIDDFKDYGKFSTPEHPSPIHHWWIGELIRQGAFVGSVLVLLSEMAKDEEEEETNLKTELDRLLESIEFLGSELGVE